MYFGNEFALLDSDNLRTPVKTVEVTLACLCGTERKTTMSVLENVAVDAVRRFTCAACCEFQRLERERRTLQEKLAKQKRLPVVEEPIVSN